MLRIKSLLFLGLLVSCSHAQSISFPTFPMPAGITFAGNYSQLGTPQFTGTLAADYPLPQGICPGSATACYGITSAEFYPVKAIDPSSKKTFYAIDTSITQSYCKDLLDTRKSSFLLCGGLGPSISSSSGSAGSVSVDLSTDVRGVWAYQISPIFSAVLAARAVYINGAGWDLRPTLGVRITIGKLPPKK